MTSLKSLSGHSALVIRFHHPLCMVIWPRGNGTQAAWCTSDVAPELYAHDTVMRRSAESLVMDIPSVGHSFIPISLISSHWLLGF